MTTPKTAAKPPAATPKPSATPAQATGTQPALPVDQWHGVGGEYVIDDGVRRRVGGPALPGDLPAADAV